MSNNTCRDIDKLYISLARIAEEEFSDIIEHAEIRGDRLRLLLMAASSMYGLVGEFHASMLFTGSAVTLTMQSIDGTMPLIGR